MSPPSRPRISTSWSEGQFVDLWLLVHLTSGIAGGLFRIFVPWSNQTVALVGLGLMILWEMVEFAWGVREDVANIVVDITVGMLGLSIGVWVASLVDHGTGRWLWFGVFLVAVAGTALGARAAKRRASKEGA